VHCHPYQPLATIAFIFTQIDYITDPQGFWPADSDTVVASTALGGNYIQSMQTRGRFEVPLLGHAVQVKGDIHLVNSPP